MLLLWRNTPNCFHLQVLLLPFLCQGLYRPLGKLHRSTPLLYQKCGDNMMLELIYHPKYGTIKEFSLFEELPDEPEPVGTTASRRAMDRAERLVQVSLPFL